MKLSRRRPTDCAMEQRFGGERLKYIAVRRRHAARAVNVCANTQSSALARALGALRPNYRSSGPPTARPGAGPAVHLPLHTSRDFNYFTAVIQLLQLIWLIAVSYQLAAISELQNY